MYLGIEIGGTKLQLGVGDGQSAHVVEVVRVDVDARCGASAILGQIQHIGVRLIRKYPIQAVGIGFGGPVDLRRGITLKSHHVNGWEEFPIVDWIRNTLGAPAVLANDCDGAAMAEALFGAGKAARSVFFVTVGSGVGGGLVLDRRLYGQDRQAVAEIGHLRPGLLRGEPDHTVESVCSGWGIAAAVQELVRGEIERRKTTLAGPRVESYPTPTECAFRATDGFVNDLLSRCGSRLETLTGKMIAEAARDGNEIARCVVEKCTDVLGWAIAQTITLIAPEVVVIGGGVSLMGEGLFFSAVRRAVAKYVFPPLANSCSIVPASLGELVVVHGALALAAR